MSEYGLIGRTLTHSFSKNYFEKKFAAEGITDCRYYNFELPSIDHFLALLQEHPNLCGVNVTIPYKEEILQFLTEKNEIVNDTHACNCIKIDGEIISGFNTDVIGFRKSLEPKLKSHHKKALILGTGGAAKAVSYVLGQLGIENKFVSRKASFNDIGYHDIGDGLLADHFLIINTTPLGMYPNVDADPPIPYEMITPKHFLFDLIYNPEKTKFLLSAEKRGAQIANGYEMLILQAEESWKIWNNL